MALALSISQLAFLLLPTLYYYYHHHHHYVNSSSSSSSSSSCWQILRRLQGLERHLEALGLRAEAGVVRSVVEAHLEARR